MFNGNRKFYLFCSTMAVIHLGSTRALRPWSSIVPVDFRPPMPGAADYWRQGEHLGERGNRKFFFEASEEGFREIMSEFFGTRGAIERHPWPMRSFHVSGRHLGPEPIAPVYAALPATAYIRRKPVRASVIKLEPVMGRFTGQAQRHRVESPTLATLNYPTNLGSILNQVLIENSKQEKSEPLNLNRSLPVLPRAVHVPLKTEVEEPSSEIYFRRPAIKPFPRVKSHMGTNSTETSEMSARKLRRPPQQESGSQTTVRTIPYVTFSPGMAPTSADRKAVAFTSNVPLNLYRKGIYDDVTHSHWTNTAQKNESNHSQGWEVREEKTNNRNETKNRASVEMIANLTADGISRGLSKALRVTENPANRIDVKRLLDYERRKFSNDTDSSEKEQLRPGLNFNDEYSLDAKILKDTNWERLEKIPLEAVSEVNPGRISLVSTHSFGDKGGEARDTTTPTYRSETARVSGEKEKAELQMNAVGNENRNPRPAECETPFDAPTTPLSSEEDTDTTHGMNDSTTSLIPVNDTTEVYNINATTASQEWIAAGTSATSEPEIATTTQKTSKPASFRRKYKKRFKASNFSTNPPRSIEGKQLKTIAGSEGTLVKGETTTAIPLSGSEAMNRTTTFSEESRKRRKKLTSKRAYRRLKKTSSSEGTAEFDASHRNVSTTGRW